MIVAEPVAECSGVRCFLCDEHRRATTKVRGDGTSVFSTILICDECRAGLVAALSPALDVDQVGGGPVGRGHPATSRRAAATVKVGTQLSALLDIMGGPAALVLDGLTSAEAAPQLSMAVGHTISRNQTTTRMGELRDRRLVVDTGRTRATENGNEATVWQITELGRAEHARITS